MTSTTKENATKKTLARCQHDALIDTPQKMDVGELDG